MLSSELRAALRIVLLIPLWHWFRGQHRRFAFRRAMRRFLANPEDSIQPGNSIVADLIYGWGNEAWSADEEYLTACVQHALEANVAILECGSGITTLLIGAVAKSRGIPYWVLEHAPEWASKVASELRGHSLDNVTLDANPLKDYGDFCWYDPSIESMPESFDLVICDGPPGSTRGGRIGLSTVMRGRLRTGCVVLLDDASRKQEVEVAKQWQVELRASSQLCGEKSPYLRLVVDAYLQ